MTSDDAFSVLPPSSAAFESGVLGIQVIVVWSNTGGWHVSSVLVRDIEGRVQRQSPWVESFLSAEDDISGEWEYFSERVRSGQGGNFYSYELSGFEVADVEHVAPIVNAIAVEAVAATYGPMGEVAGTILFDQPAGEGTLVMPFVLLPDDRGDDAFVMTGVTTEASIRLATGPEIEARPFESIKHWQRAGAMSWPVAPGSRYTVSWGHNQIDLRVGLDDRFKQIKAGANDAQRVQEAPLIFIPTDPPADDMRIERVGVPRWVTDNDYDQAAMFSLFGDDVVWSFAVPWMHRALASPLMHEPMLGAPSPGDNFWPGALGYWSSLLHLFVYSFGWSRPDRGLRWWYDAGYPIEDERLNLVSRVWRSDGQLDLLAAWLWTTPTPDVLAAVTDYRSDYAPVRVDEAWMDGVRRKRSEWEGPSPFGGGSDPLHLAGHLDGPIANPGDGVTLLRSSREERRAVLLTDSLAGWYRALVEHGATLPDLGDLSWHVDVVARSVGWLGTYRRSRVTNLWFAGKHRYHVVGN